MTIISTISILNTASITAQTIINGALRLLQVASTKEVVTTALIHFKIALTFVGESLALDINTIDFEAEKINAKNLAVGKMIAFYNNLIVTS